MCEQVVLAIPCLVAYERRKGLSHSRFSARPWGHRVAPISTRPSPLRDFTAIDAHLGNEGRRNPHVGAGNEFTFSLLSLQGMRKGTSLEARSLIFI